MSSQFSDFYRLPKLGPAIIVRSRIQQWLHKHADVPLRLIAAPTGCGKTVACATYAKMSRKRAAYLRIPADAKTDTFLRMLARTVEFHSIPADYPGLVDALKELGSFELILDDVDAASSELMPWLECLVHDAPDDVTFVYTTRSRYIFETTSMLAHGVAVICDAGILAFTADEAVQLVGKLGLACSDAAIGRLLFETEGWAVALAGAVREGHASDCSLDIAYEAWREKEGRRFAEFIQQNLERVGEQDREALSRLMWGVAMEPERAARLEALGLPVRYVNGNYRVYRVLARLQLRQTAMAETALPKGVPLLSLQMFGSFQATIENKPIQWLRRRDQQIVKYLALQPEQRCPRNELMQKFWPEADHLLALQSLRTACSNIRKAISFIVGRAAADQYLIVGREIGLNASATLIDVRRFVSHVNEGNAAYESGDAESALQHFRSAQTLYGGRLCDDDPLFAPYAAMYESMLTLSISRIREQLENLKDVEAKKAVEDGTLLASFAQ